MRNAAIGRAYQRAITPAEWIYLGLPTSQDIQYVIEGEGDLRPEDVVEAVRLASEASPGTRLVRRGKLWVDSGVSPAVHVMDGPLDRQRLDSPALQTRVSRPGTFFEVLLSPGDPASVVLRGWHAVTDARGLALWAADVFRVLRGQDPVGVAAEQHGVPRSAASGGAAPDPARRGGVEVAVPAQPRAGEHPEGGVAQQDRRRHAPRPPPRRSPPRSRPRTGPRDGVVSSSRWTCAGTIRTSGPRPGCRRR